MPIVECKCGKTISVSVADFQAGVELSARIVCPEGLNGGRWRRRAR